MSKRLKGFATEYRAVTFEVKAFDPQAGTIEGYASTWDLDQGGDIIVKGAFAKTVQERVPAGLVKLLDSHYWDGQHTIGTVTQAREDDRGLYIVASLAGTPDAQAIRQKVMEGHLNRFSIGFEVVRERWQRDAAGNMVRYIDELKLYEVSVVPFPMNEQATVTGVKAQSFEQILRSGNLREQFWLIQDALIDAMLGIIEDEQETDKVNATAQSIDQYKATMVQWMAQAQSSQLLDARQAVATYKAARKSEPAQDPAPSAGPDASPPTGEGARSKAAEPRATSLTAALDVLETELSLMGE
ncbi:MAG: HK97 family phage prohead protease [Bacillota bacterium]